MATFEGQPEGHLLNPKGTVHGGFLSEILDSALGNAVLSRPPGGVGRTSMQLSVHLVPYVFPYTAAHPGTSMVPP